jgi:hypothetical protein
MPQPNSPNYCCQRLPKLLLSTELDDATRSLVARPLHLKPATRFLDLRLTHSRERAGRIIPNRLISLRRSCGRPRIATGPI